MPLRNRLCALACAALCLLTGCAAQPTAPESEAVSLVITLDTTAELYCLSYDYFLGGELVGGGDVQNADGSPLADTVRLALTPTDLPAGADIESLSLQLYLADSPLESGDLNAAASHSGQQPVGGALPLAARYGETRRITLTGDRDSGYTATLQGDELTPAADPLDAAIRRAIVDANSGSYLPGECCGVGYQVIERFEEDGVVSVYALTEYVEYGFQDNVFVNISGTNPKVLIQFSVQDGAYTPLFYTRLDLFSDLSEEELEKLLEPLKRTGKNYFYTDADLQKVRAQADADAAAYLASIGRQAEVAARSSHAGRRLSDLISDPARLNELLHSEVYAQYPDWLGSTERLEGGVRYVYTTALDNETATLTFTKTRYDTGEVIAQLRLPATE